MPTHSWNGHVLEVRCELLPFVHARLWARADDRRFEFVEVALAAASNSEFARQNPGSTWLPLAEVPFTLRENDRVLPCKAEFEVSLYPPVDLHERYRYRIFVDNIEVVAGQTAAKSSGGSCTFLVVFLGFYIVMILAFWFRLWS